MIKRFERKLSIRVHALIPGLVIMAFLFLYAAGNYVWLKRDLPSGIVKAQPFLYLNELGDSYELLSGAPLWEWPARLRLRRFPAYEPLYLASSVAAADLFGPSLLRIILSVNLFYFAVTLVFLFLIGKKLLSARVGVMACVFLALFPGVYGGTRFYYVQVAEMAVAVAALYVLLRSDGFARTGTSLVFGVCSGLAFLTKFETTAFLAGPAFVAVVAGAWRDRHSSEPGIFLRRALNFLAAGAVACGMAWFHFEGMGTGLLVRLSEDWVDDRWYNFRLFTAGLAEGALGLFFAAILVAVAPVFAARRDVTPAHKVGLALWCLIPWTGLVLMRHFGYLVYVLPFLPALALVMAGGIDRLPPKARHVALAVIVVVGLVQYRDFSFTENAGLGKIRIAGRPFFRPVEDLSRAPRSYEEELAAIEEGWRRAARIVAGKANPKIVVWTETFPDPMRAFPAPRWRTLDLFIKKFPAPFEVRWFQPDNFEKIIESTDHILVFDSPEMTRLKTARWYRTHYEAGAFFPLTHMSSKDFPPLLKSPAEYQRKLETLEAKYLGMMDEFTPRPLTEWRGQVMVLFERNRRDETASGG
jgi:hypothetical protein